MEWRSVGGGFLEPGPATVWMGMGCELVAGMTLPQRHGIGTAESVLSDERGRVGRAVQTLLIAER